MSQSDFVTRGQALVSAGQYQEAVKVCRLGLLGRPTTVEGRVVLGQALLALKRFDEVLAEMRVALELDHASIAAQLLKGEALLRKGDPHGALEALQRARLQMPNDPRIAQLVAEAQGSLGKPSVTAGHPSVGFVGGGKAGEATRHYPSHGADEEDTSDDGRETTGDSYTRPTSLSAPSAKKKTPRPALDPGGPREPLWDATPPPAVLAVGDRSGTVEVDPELEGVELDSEDDFADLAPPPKSAELGAVRAPRTGPSEARGQVIRSQRPKAPLPAPSPARPRPRPKADISTLELDDDEMIEVPQAPPVAARAPGPGTKVRNAVQVPSGPLESQPPSPIAAARPTVVAAQPSQLAQAIDDPARGAAGLPRGLGAPAPAFGPAGSPAGPIAAPFGPAGSPGGPIAAPFGPPGSPGGPIAAALPTVAAQPPPPQPLPRPLVAPPAAAVAPTMALPPAPALPPHQQPMMPGYEQPGVPPGAPMWGAAPGAAGPGMPSAPLEPAPMFDMNGASAVMLEPSQSSHASGPRTGMRRTRSPLQIVLWFVIGGLVIGGGVFAGFQIRAMRLEKQIDEARDQADALARTDTWKGWVGARDRLAGIAQASDTPANRAALARTRARVAFEFGDGLADATAAVEGLAGQSGLDVELATAFLALARHDPQEAAAAAERALAIAASDPAARYAAGEAGLARGDLGKAVEHLEAALAADARPLHAIALAGAHGAAGAWKRAFETLDKALAGAPDHPGLLIQRAHLLAASGRIAPNVALGAEVRGQLVEIVGEGLKAPAEQPRGVSLAQVAFADLVLAEVEHRRGDLAAAKAAIKAALELNYDDQGFAEHAAETLHAVGDLESARAAAERALLEWSGSARARIVLARTRLAQHEPREALAVIGKLPDLKTRPFALAVRGHVHLALGDLDAARADLDGALAKAPDLQAAIVGRTWVDLATGKLAEARKRIEPRYVPQASPAIATAYAALLRRTGAATDRTKAREILERVVAGAPGLELERAYLELARIYRDAGDPRALKAFTEASRGGNAVARLEAAQWRLETGDVPGAHASLDKLLAASDPPSPKLLLEAARARMLDGDHEGAKQLLDKFDKLQGGDRVAADLRWKYERERGRLALRKGDLAGAAALLERALEKSGDDVDTFLLAADVAASEEKYRKLGDKLAQLAQARLANRPELLLVTGKLLLGKADLDGASKAYEEAQAALGKAKAPRRLLALANLGRAIAAYYSRNDPQAVRALDLAIALDPSLYLAYAYYMDIKKAKDEKTALAKAQTAVKLNPDFVDGWVQIGTLAHELKNRKLRAKAIARLNEIAPNHEGLRQLQRLR